MVGTPTVYARDTFFLYAQNVWRGASMPKTCGAGSAGEGRHFPAVVFGRTTLGRKVYRLAVLSPSRLP